MRNYRMRSLICAASLLGLLTVVALDFSPGGRAE